MRYSHEPAWVAIEVTEDRRAAARVAGQAFRNRANAQGETPMQVRVITTADLVREGGQDAINRAAVDLWQREKKSSIIGGC